MKVRMLTGLVGVGIEPAKPNDIVNLPRELAEAYIEAGSAEPVKPKKRKTERATRPTANVEQATSH